MTTDAKDLARRARLQVAGVVARVVIVAALVALVASFVWPEVTTGMGRGVSLLLLGVPVAAAVFVLLRPRHDDGPEWPSLLLVVVCHAVVLTSGVTRSADSALTFLWMAVVVLLSALVLPIRRHLAVTALAIIVAAGIIAAFSAEPVGDVPRLAAVTLVAVVSWLAMRVNVRTLVQLQHAHDRAQRSSDALRAVVDAARTATNADAQDVLDAVAAATAHLGSDTCGLYLLDEHDQLYYAATMNIPDELLSASFPRDTGIAGHTLAERRTVVTNDYRRYTRANPSYQEHALQAAIGCPIHIDDEVIGVLVAGRYDDAGYDEATITAFELLADHAGRALALARAIGEERATLASLRHLHALQEDFVSTVSHELRTPITVVDGIALTLLRFGEDADPDQRRHLLERLATNTATLSSVVTSILELARLDRGLAEVASDPVDLCALVESSVARLQPMLADHVLQVDLRDVSVPGDAHLLQRVVDNLLTNAAQHTPPGTTVTVRIERTSVHATVAVSDDGPGIPAHEVHRITDRFRRGGETLTRRTRGLGLGLALTQQVLQHHGSRLRVRSEVGVGTTFWFRLHRHGAEPRPAPAASGGAR